MRSVALCLLILSCGCAGAQQASYNPEPRWKEVCAAATSKPLAAPALNGPLPAAALPKCDETALYYGSGGKPDDAAALQCGWYQRAHPRPSVGDMFYGPGVLSMLYANGRGVPRNPDLALRFACENEWAAPAEMEGRIGHLEALRSAPAAGRQPFDLCDDITSGLSMGFCTKVQTDARDSVRARSIAAEVAKLPPAARSAFPALQRAEDAFDQARSRNEIDLSGTARGMFSLEEEAKLRDQFLINLQRFGKGDVPAVSAAELASLEARLSATYGALQKQVPQSADIGGTVTAGGIATTQKAWLALEDAWLHFAPLAYPKLAPERVRAQLVRLRLHQLRSLQPAS